MRISIGMKGQCVRQKKNSKHSWNIENNLNIEDRSNIEYKSNIEDRSNIEYKSNIEDKSNMENKPNIETKSDVENNPDIQLNEKRKTIKNQYVKARRDTCIVYVIALIVFIVCVIYGFSNKDNENYIKEQSTHTIANNDSKEVANNDELEKININAMVCLDAGHGGSDPGAMYGERMEKDDNLRLTKTIGKKLENKGIKVIYTRTQDESMALKKRAKFANRMQADLFVSLHRNFFEGDHSINGIDLYIDKKNSEEDKALGMALYKNISSVNGMKVNEPKKGSTTDENENYTVVGKTQMPACLVEMGYLSNANDNKAFDDKIEDYATAVCNGIIEYLNNYKGNRPQN